MRIMAVDDEIFALEDFLYIALHPQKFFLPIHCRMRKLRQAHKRRSSPRSKLRLYPRNPREMKIKN